MTERALIISGPTGVGKSAAATQLALGLRGEILNIDAVQVYQELDIGSAKPSLAERAVVPHHLFDIVNPSQHFELGSYLSAARAALGDVVSRGRLPVFVGGSTLYITALLHGLGALPERNEEIRERLLSRPVEENYAELLQVDSAAAKKIESRDQIRIARALEVFQATGQRWSELIAKHQFSDQHLHALIVVVLREREELYRRIEQRTNTMVQLGLLQEMRGLVKRHGQGLRIFSTIGYREALEVIQGRLDERSMADAIAQATRQYAKRQLTFWRNEPKKRGWEVVMPPDSQPLFSLEGVPTWQLSISELQEVAATTLAAGHMRSQVLYVRIRELD